MYKTKLLVLFCCLGAGIAFAKPATLTTNSSYRCNYPGGIVLKTVPCNSEIYFHDNRVLVVQNHSHCIAIAGIPLSGTPGSAKLIIKTKKRTKEITFQIIPKKYPAEHFTVKKPRYLKKPSAALWERIKKEQKIINSALNHWDSKLYSKLNFSLPVKGRFSSPFGLTRMINGKLRSRHRGLDIAAMRGTKIKAPAAGYIANTGHYFFSGKSVIIDHGQGLITFYGHLAKILVKTGQFVHKGQVLGLVGSTGRSTGPHLHWGACLNHNRINPLLLLQLTTIINGTN